MMIQNPVTPLKRGETLRPMLRASIAAADFAWLDPG